MNKPTLSNVSQLDTAVLLEKFIVLNGMLLHGTKEEKARAKSMLVPLQEQALQCMNTAAMEQAKFDMNVSHEELSSSKGTPLFPSC